MGKAEWGGNPASWWLDLYFCFFCCLDEASWIGCYCWLGDAGSYIQVVSFVWILTIWYSLGLVLWLSRALKSVLLLQGLRAWSCWWFTIRKTCCWSTCGLFRFLWKQASKICVTPSFSSGTPLGPEFTPWKKRGAGEPQHLSPLRTPQRPHCSCGLLQLLPVRLSQAFTNMNHS